MTENTKHPRPVSSGDSNGQNGRRRRVLFLVHNHPAVRPGGAEAYAVELYRALRDHADFEPFLVARTDAPARAAQTDRETPFAAVDDDPNQYFLRTHPRDFDFFHLTARNKSLHVRHLRDFLLALRPDLIHVQHTLFIGNDILPLIRQTLPDVPIVYTLHEFLAICHRNGQMVRATDEQNCLEASPRRCAACFPNITPEQFFLRERLTKSHFQHVDLFLAPSRFLMERYIDWGIPRDRIRFEDYGRLARRAPPSGPDRPRNRFGYFGQFTPYKGATVALEAMALLAREGSDAHLRVHGANLEIQPEDFQARFRALLDESADNVTMHGRYEHHELHALMDAVDWVIVPSTWWENSPLVIQEAFLHGRPVLCSDIGGMAEKVDHEVNGLHFRVGNPQSLADTIRRATESPGLWDQLRAGIPEIYPMDRHVSVITETYAELLRSQRVLERVS
jgi:glycosyltransferase involved in cell wall biosynthesis